MNPGLPFPDVNLINQFSSSQDTNFMAWLTFSAILLSPLIAVLVSMRIQYQIQKHNTKLNILAQLMGDRHILLSPDSIRALNMIDLFFHDHKQVRTFWNQYLDMLKNEGLNNPNGWEQRKTKRNELVTEMARVLGYGEAIDHLDIDRVYVPEGPAVQEDVQRLVFEELLRVLRATESLAIRRRKKGTGNKTED